MNEFLHAAGAVLLACVAFVPVMFTLTALWKLALDLKQKAYGWGLVIGGIFMFVVIIGPRGLLALYAIVGPVASNWKNHPLSSIAYALTLLGLYAYLRVRNRTTDATPPTKDEVNRP